MFCSEQRLFRASAPLMVSWLWNVKTSQIMKNWYFFSEKGQNEGLQMNVMERNHECLSSHWSFQFLHGDSGQDSYLHLQCLLVLPSGPDWWEKAETSLKCLLLTLHNSFIVSSSCFACRESRRFTLAPVSDVAGGCLKEGKQQNVKAVKTLQPLVWFELLAMIVEETCRDTFWSTDLNHSSNLQAEISSRSDSWWDETPRGGGVGWGGEWMNEAMSSS